MKYDRERRYRNGVQGGRSRLIRDVYGVLGDSCTECREESNNM